MWLNLGLNRLDEAQQRKTMNEAQETQATSGTSSLQRAPKSRSLKELEAHIASCDRAEADLYARRGYGGYIDSETLQQIRDGKEKSAKELTARRKVKVEVSPLDAGQVE